MLSRSNRLASTRSERKKKGKKLGAEGLSISLYLDISPNRFFARSIRQPVVLEKPANICFIYNICLFLYLCKGRISEILGKHLLIPKKSSFFLFLNRNSCKLVFFRVVLCIVKEEEKQCVDEA